MAHANPVFMDEKAMKQVNDYTPSIDTCTAEEWLMVRPFVVAAVAPVTAPASAVGPLAGITTQLAVWALGNGFDLSVDALFSPLSIESFVAIRGGDHRGTVRSWLRRIATAHGIEDARPVKVVYGRTQKQQVYAPGEVLALRQFANGLSNENRETTLRAMFALGFGCGLSAGDMKLVSADCVHVHDDGLVAVVVPGENERCVPVLASWVDDLLVAAECRPTGSLVSNSSGKNTTNEPARWMRGKTGLPLFNTFRMRGTWAVEHLTLGTSLVELMHWMALGNVEALQPYFEQVSYRPECTGGSL